MPRIRIYFELFLIDFRGFFFITSYFMRYDGITDILTAFENLITEIARPILLYKCSHTADQT